MDSNKEDCKTTLRVAGVVQESVVDGPGMRYTVFAQGCPHACPGCHNAHTHAYDGGTQMSVASCMADIARNPLLSGVTFTGGEPFAQAGAFAALAKEIKARGLELAVYSGYTYEELTAGDAAWLALLRFADVLIDGRFIASQKSLELNFKGSKNQRVIDVQRSLAAGRAVLNETARWN